MAKTVEVGRLRANFDQVGDNFDETSQIWAGIVELHRFWADFHQFRHILDRKRPGQSLRRYGHFERKQSCFCGLLCCALLMILRCAFNIASVSGVIESTVLGFDRDPAFFARSQTTESAVLAVLVADVDEHRPLCPAMSLSHLRTTATTMPPWIQLDLHEGPMHGPFPAHYRLSSLVWLWHGAGVAPALPPNPLCI